MLKYRLMLVVGLLATCGLAHPAAAIVSYHKEFIKLYVDKDAKPESDLAKIIKDKKKKCLVCHQGKKKKNCNPYGEQLGKLLDKKKDKKNIEKIIASLKKVEEMRSDPENKNSPTYRTLLAAGKLPGGSLGELQKEPADKDVSSE